MTDEYCTRETELTSHHGYLTGEMTTAERLLSQIQEVTSLSPVVSKEQCVMGREGHTTDWERLIRDRKSTRLNSSHVRTSRMPSSA